MKSLLLLLPIFVLTGSNALSQEAQVMLPLGGRITVDRTTYVCSDDSRPKAKPCIVRPQYAVVCIEADYRWGGGSEKAAIDAAYGFKKEGACDSIHTVGVDMAETCARAFRLYSLGDTIRIDRPRN